MGFWLGFGSFLLLFGFHPWMVRRNYPIKTNLWLWVFRSFHCFFWRLDSLRLYASQRTGSWWECMVVGSCFRGLLGLRGIDVDFFYRLQTWIFGNGVDWKTIICKVLLINRLLRDLGLPDHGALYGWKESGYSGVAGVPKSTLRNFW